MKNKVSIIIPYYNGEKYFEKLVISILKSIILVDISFSFQIIVIIDSIETKTDFINHILSNLGNLTNVKFEIIKNKINEGVARSRNIGFSIANGDLIHLIDQDDTIEPLFYPTIFQASKKFNFILVNGNVNYEIGNYSNHKLYYFNQKLNIDKLVWSDFIRSPGQIVFSKELILNLKFPEPLVYKGADDRFFWFKMFIINNNLIKPIYLHQTLYNACIHSDNYSLDKINLLYSALENWYIFLKENTIDKKLLRSINNNIKSLKYSAKVKQSVNDSLIGFIFRSLYFVDANKIIRFIFKRIKPFKFNS
jgi:glycosyltransferase involved in cell wall biosynthesis